MLNALRNNPDKLFDWLFSKYFIFDEYTMLKRGCNVYTLSFCLLAFPFKLIVVLWVSKKL